MASSLEIAKVREKMMHFWPKMNNNNKKGGIFHYLSFCINFLALGTR